MDINQALGLAAAVITTAANIPQAVKVLKTRSTKSLSAVTYSMLFTGMALWTVYGILKKDVPIIIGNAIGATLCGIILFVKLLSLFRRKKPA